MKIPVNTDQGFLKLLRKIRKEEKIYLEQLSEGLMMVSQLARIEKEQRPVPKNMRDRLLGRLGVSSDLYENLLNIEDYAEWEHQRNILCAIERRETKHAQELLLAYEEEPPVHDRIKQQFCLVMRAEIMKQQQADQQQLADCYEKAVKCTIPDVEDMCLEKKLLSIQEINMLLEYEWYHKGANYAAKCKELLAYVEKAVYDDLSKVKIYPKIAYYFMQEIFSEQNQCTEECLRESLQICNQAIEMLRDTGRAFYLLELLEMKMKLLKCMDRESGEDEKLQSEYHESSELVRLLKKLYVEYDVPAYMQDCTYLYQQRWVFYIGDVLRIRREMYGLTQKQLCDGVCSVRTLRRAEKREANMQRDALGVLLRRVGLSKEFQRTRIVTNDREVLQLKKQMLTCRNNRDFVKCRELLTQMRERIDLEIPENRQYMIDLEASLDWMEHKITNDEFVRREEEALQCTLKMEKCFNVDEMYLTEMEVSCIRKRIRGQEGIAKRKSIDFLLRFFEMYEERCRLSDCIAMYEYIIIYIASELANIGEYQLAMELDKKLLKEDLLCRRLWMVGNVLYDVYWIEAKQGTEKNLLMNKEKMTEKLVQCKLLSHFCKQVFHEKFYSEKIYQS